MLIKNEHDHNDKVNRNDKDDKKNCGKSIRRTIDDHPGVHNNEGNKLTNNNKKLILTNSAYNAR